MTNDTPNPNEDKLLLGQDVTDDDDDDDELNPDEQLFIRYTIVDIQSLALELVHHATGFELECSSSPFDVTDADSALDQVEDVVKKLREKINILDETQ